MMRKSEYVCSHLEQLKRQKRFLNHFLTEDIRMRWKHSFKLCEQVRPKRRIALWKAYILLDGHRSWHDKDC